MVYRPQFSHFLSFFRRRQSNPAHPYFLHNFSGITMFLFSVLGIFGADALASPLRGRLARGRFRK
jgi:hypothetical protein